MYNSETSNARATLSKWCQGFGIDVGHGGDKIVPHAIAVDLMRPYAQCGGDPIQLGGDAKNLHWFQDSVLDFVYSSHLLEDFDDTTEVLNEWARVLKFNGHLILYLPDEQVYRAHCAKSGQPQNPGHKHAHFNAAYVKQCVEKSFYYLELVHESPIVYSYSFELVFKKK